MTAASTPADDFDAAAYEAAGLSAVEGRSWWEWRISAAAAVRWRAAGVTDPLAAAQWDIAGVGQDEIDGWRSAGIPAREAIGWHEFGFDLPSAIENRSRGRTPEDAYDVSQGREPAGARGGANSGTGFLNMVGLSGSGVQQETDRFISKVANSTGIIMYSYLVQGWTDDEAIAWASQKIDAAAARTWQELGLRPAEAGRFIRRGVNPMAVARDWWRVGIPFDEVASWLGAGLTPAEALDQRGRGVTVEQAETLRVLRSDRDG
jgi:hypothetical protein